ncbi:hypothetical protein [Actinopolymorpha pittospori]|uniref:Uncharacterized protein n=1 Tax=Actinopolymorpha pittospori TaxID=648752 RepID=A0A927N544_9ACTN|nr:hypothetical protein [Actinopolymorpha pittospori]MBE1608710.1 hypothetical protein [Actinopolymorpha pittospori]
MLRGSRHSWAFLVIEVRAISSRTPRATPCAAHPHACTRPALLDLAPSGLYALPLHEPVPLLDRLPQTYVD